MMQFNNTYDIIITGAGIAGISAAYKAGSMGMKVLLVEHYPFIGGMATTAMVSPFMKSSVEDKDLVKGFFQLLQDGMNKIGGMIDNGFFAWAFRYEANRLLKEVHVDLALGCDLVQVQRTGNSIDHVVLSSLHGIQKVSGKQFIDASGDAQVLFLGDFPYETGDISKGEQQAQTLFFRMGGIHFKRATEYCRQHKEDFLDWMDYDFNLDRIISVAGYKSLVNKAKKQGMLPQDIDYIFYTSLPSTGEASFNTSNILHHDARHSDSLTKAELEGHRQVMQIAEFVVNEIVGFENAYLIESGIQVGVRETRRGICEYQVTGQDILTGASFSDAVARGCYGIDFHGQKPGDNRMDEMQSGKWYEIPARALIVKNAANVLVAGRCIGSTREGHSALRIMPTSAATGEAAGALAALAVRHKKAPVEVPYTELKEQIIHNIDS